MDYEQLVVRLEDADRLLGLSAHTLRRAKGRRVAPVARRVLSFLERRATGDPVGCYVRRARELRALQERFEETGRYPASRYEEIPPVDREDYNTALLLSTILTQHRFEILEELVAFYRRPGAGPKSLLSVGYGTGFEIAQGIELLPDWTIEGYEVSAAVDRYARSLLEFFDLPADGLRLERFPLEDGEDVGRHRGRYGKVVACELLEHLEMPERALRNLHRSTHPEGELFLTFAVNLAQEDHLHLYRSADDARRQVADSGLEIVHEKLVPVSVLPYDDKDRERLFRKGNLVCIARPNR